MALPIDTCGDTLPPGTPRPDGRNTAFPITCRSGLRGTRTRAVGGTGRPLPKTFLLHCQRRHPELPKIPTYLPLAHLLHLNCCCYTDMTTHGKLLHQFCRL